MSTALAITEPKETTRRQPRSLLGNCILGIQLVIVLLAMALTALVMMLAWVVTLGHSRRFNLEVVGRTFCRFTLWVCGVRLVVHHEAPIPSGRVVYISNHTSTLDCFILPALGLPNARFFLSGFLRKNPLICITGYLTGTLWTCPQLYPEKRARVFQKAEAILRRTGESVYASPEGERVRTGMIGPFNKGAFHLATNLKAPLVPCYIAIPNSVDPGLGADTRPGVVHVTFKPLIETGDWKLEDLDDNRRRVRQLFVQWHEELRIRT
jgi:1-acyl-sn-glycerol-3-phosphate acyltransferase